MDQEHRQYLKEMQFRPPHKEPKVVTRKPLSDAEKFQIIQQYSQGVSEDVIAKSVSRDTFAIKELISTVLTNMASVKETNDLLGVKCTADFKRAQGATPTRFLSSSFLSKIEEAGDIYAHYYAETGDNRFALEQSKLDVGIPVGVSKATKDYILRIRGQYLRDIPSIKKYIREVQDKRIAEYRIEKPQVQMELVSQIEELKEASQKDSKQRSNLLRAIELLGKTIGAFTDRVEVEEADAKSGLQLILEKAKREVLDATDSGYSIEDIDGEEADSTGSD